MKSEKMKEMMNKKSLFVALPMMVALALTGCSTSTIGAKEVTAPTSQSASPSTAPTSAPSTETSKTSETPAPMSSGSVKDALNNLVVADEIDAASYERTYFNHWVSKNPSGCDTRFAVLVTESTTKTKISGCKVISGTWVSAYDGVTVTDPSKLDIDHMVPLKEAWRSGASKWNDSQREAYANDLEYANSLVAVTAASNRSKSDDDPSKYLPSDANNQCSYVSHWVAVKTRWSLAVDAKEKNAIQTVLNKCGDIKLDDVKKAGSVPAPVAGSSATNASETPKSAPPETTKVEAPAPAASTPVANTDGSDPKFSSCKEALAAGYGPYKKGEPEYEWYRDGDGDGTVCEK
jgi:hypothetical protein